MMDVHKHDEFVRMMGVERHAAVRLHMSSSVKIYSCVLLWTIYFWMKFAGIMEVVRDLPRSVSVGL